MTTSTLSQFDVHQATTGFIRQSHKIMINNEWVDAVSGKTFPVYDPATGEVFTHVAEGDKPDVEKAVKAARQAFENGPWRQMSPSQRGQLIWKLGDLLEEKLEEFASLESLDNGKPVEVAKGADVPLAVDMFRYMAGWATKIDGKTIPISVPYAPDQKYFAYTNREPIGVVGQIIPWNFPLLMAVWKLAPALAAGCCMILKPAEQTPLTALRLGELIIEAGFPPGVVNIVPGYGSAGAALAAHDGVDKVAFTGSTEVGKLIVQAAAGNLKKVTLELGGKSPNVIFNDADLDVAIEGAANAIFFNHGQCCCAGSRLYVEKKIFDQVIEGVSDHAKNIKLGPGLDPQTVMGPLVSDEQLKRVCGYLESGMAQGATATTGGKRQGDQGYFVEPTVLVNTNHTMKVVQEEIFGPVVTAMPFDDINQIASLANDTTYGLAAGVWTRDIAKAHHLVEKIKAGTVWVNCYNIYDAALPFGGYKQSGWGREMGGDVMECYTETKSVVTAI